MSRYFYTFMLFVFLLPNGYGNTIKSAILTQIEEDSTISVLKLTKKTTNREKV